MSFIEETEGFDSPTCLRPSQNPNYACGCEDKCMFADGLEVNPEIIDAVSKMEQKYFKLVWYARKSPEDVYKFGIEKPIKEVEFLYEEETKELKGEHGDWQHGFNSGALAAFRYILTISDFGIEAANEEFPFLDT